MGEEAVKALDRCASCGSKLPDRKNLSRMSKWRRALPRKCRGCAGTKHNMSGTRLYHSWQSMRERCGLTKCSNPQAVKYYISKGITVCRSWSRFAVFAKWALANGYHDSLSLDRKRSSRNYSPGNCRWVSMRDNLRNRDDRKLSLEKARAIRARYKSGDSTSALAVEYGVSQGCIYSVISGRRWAA